MPKDRWEGKTAEQIFALGGKGSAAKKAYEASGAEAPWSRDLSSQLRKSARETDIGQQTKKYQDFVSGPSGFSDIYRSGKAGQITGPEHHLGKSRDVDVHGYPSGWKIEAADGGQWITPDTGSWKGRKYFKPTDTGGGGGGGGDQQSTVTSDTKMDMATLTDEMDLSNKLTEIINTNSPLFKAATTRAMQGMAKRGIVNSSIAQGEVMNSILAVAMPIAQAEVKNLTDNMYYNTDWTNKDKIMANEYAQQAMLKKIQGAIDKELRLMTEQGSYTRQRMGDMAGLMKTGYGEDDQPDPSIWGKYSSMFLP